MLYSDDAYDNVVSSGGSENDYLFAGEQPDGETGLDYLRVRYYDPTLGRFISADADDGSLNDPMSLHDYFYAHANPVVIVILNKNETLFWLESFHGKKPSSQSKLK